MRSQRAFAVHRSFRKRSLAQEFGEGSQVHAVQILTAPWVGGRLSSFSGARHYIAEGKRRRLPHATSALSA